MRKIAMVLGMLASGSAWAQTPAAPTSPTGNTPPGAPGAGSVPEQISRNSAGQQIIGHTTTPSTAVPGNTGGQGTGATKP